MHSVCQVPLKLDEFICLLHLRLCDVTIAHVHCDDDAQIIYHAALGCTLRYYTPMPGETNLPQGSWSIPVF